MEQFYFYFATSLWAKRHLIFFLLLSYSFKWFKKISAITEIKHFTSVLHSIKIIIKTFLHMDQSLTHLAYVNERALEHLS